MVASVTTELVLLSEMPLSLEVMETTARQLLPDGVGIAYRGGQIIQWVGSDGIAVLTVFEPARIEDAAEADRALNAAPSQYSVWTELMVPFEGGEKGRSLAEGFAGAIGGVIREKL